MVLALTQQPYPSRGTADMQLMCIFLDDVKVIHDWMVQPAGWTIESGNGGSRRT